MRNDKIYGDYPMFNYKIMTFAALASLALAPGFASACTQQEAMAKATQLSQLVQAKMAQDPSAGQAMMAKMQPIMQSYQSQVTTGGTINWDAVCTQYDSLIAQAK
jgi:hypothetical protein